MAFNIKTILKAAGLDEAKISETVNEIEKGIKDNYVENKVHNSKITEISELNSRLEKVKDYDTLKTAKEKAEADLATFKTETEKEKSTAIKTAALEKALKGVNVHAEALDLVAGKFDLDKIELDDKGNIKDFETLIKPIKESKPSLFGVTTITGKDPVKVPSALDITKPFKEMTTAERTAFKEKDPEAFKVEVEKVSTRTY